MNKKPLSSFISIHRARKEGIKLGQTKAQSMLRRAGSAADSGSTKAPAPSFAASICSLVILTRLTSIAIRSRGASLSSVSSATIASTTSIPLITLPYTV